MLKTRNKSEEWNAVKKIWVTGSLSRDSVNAFDLCAANISKVFLQLFHCSAVLCLCLLGDVYIQPTQDTKNPVIYGVFSVSGWVWMCQTKSPSAVVNTGRGCLAWVVVSCFCICFSKFTSKLHFLYIMNFITKTLAYFSPPALYSKAQRSAFTPWRTFGWCSMDLLPTKKVPIISGWPTLEKSPTLVQEQWVSPSYESEYH